MHGLPSLEALERILGPDCHELLPRLLDASLVEAARSQMQRHRKQLRSRLLRFGYELALGLQAANDPTAGRKAELDEQRRETSLRKACEAIELLHEGSLMIDDIQDNSPVRRGGPCAHLVYGVASTLCTGNWLYFWPLRLLGELGLPALQENQLIKRYTEAIEKAHYGQALDLHVQVNKLGRADVAQVSRKIAELKTGVITSLAIEIGATIAGATPQQLQSLSTFGCHFGVALQNFDDLGNLSERLSPEKRFEDMLQRKPSFVWAYASEVLCNEQWLAFTAAVDALPCNKALLAFLSSANLVEQATKQAQAILAEAYTLLDHDLEACQVVCRDELYGLGERLTNAYG